MPPGRPGLRSFLSEDQRLQILLVLRFASGNCMRSSKCAWRRTARQLIEVDQGLILSENPNQLGVLAFNLFFRAV